MTKPLSREASIAGLHPELAMLAGFPARSLSDETLAEARAASDMLMAQLSGSVSVMPEVIEVPGHAGAPPVVVRVHRPQEAPVRLAILHVHGGGMVLGSASSMDGILAATAAKHSAVVASVEYRLAPETPFPGPLFDCAAAWLWLNGQAEALGLTPDNLIVMGESAGGGLAAALCLYLRDTGAPQPAGQVLTYPMLDYQTGLGIETEDTRLGWTSANNQYGWGALLGDQPVPTGQGLGHYSPAHAQSLSGLPPCWIGVGGLDLFLDENIAYAAKIASLGGEVTLQTWPGAPHGFQMLPCTLTAQFNKALFNAIERFAS
jgi:acetyl esterase